MNLIISNTSQEPIYEQIANQLRDLIIRGELLGGEPLPSIRNLAKELQISVITTKRAYDELEHEGFIRTIPGKGSFVAPQNKEMLKEQRLRVIEEKLAQAVQAAKGVDIELKQMQEMLSLLYEED